MGDRHASLSALLAALRSLEARMRPATLPGGLLAGSATLGVVLLVLTLLLRRKKYVRKLVEDPGLVARRVEKEGEYALGEYDVVVVGGGTAGCALASRLSEDPSIRVLLIEAGRSSLDLTYSQIPAGLSRLFHSQDDYDLYTTPQPHAGGKARFWPRAKLLGGCSSMNAMIFHHCPPSDYDEWVKYQKGAEGADGWSYKNFLPYFIKFEKFHPHEKFSLVDTTLRGSNGPLTVGYFGHFGVAPERFIETCSKIGIAKNPDFNAGNSMGVSKVSMTTIDPRGRRVTTESSYLTREVLARPNLKVATKARATKILFGNEQYGKEPRAVGVRFVDEKGETYEVRARKEVVLCAGAIHTPQLLMVSGVGPSEHLSSLDIPVVADLPGVGSHLMDHPSVDLFFKDKFKNLAGAMTRIPTTWKRKWHHIRSLTQYILTGRGPLTSNIAEVAAFIKSNDKKLFKPDEFIPDAELEDTASGLDAPDVELFCSPQIWLEHGYGEPFDGYNFGLHASLLRPTSTGTVRLSSADPLNAPVIDPNYLATKHDVAVLARSVRLLSRIVHTQPLAEMLDPAGLKEPMFNHELDSQSDAEIEQLVRERAETLYHPTSTARMAPREDGGVVDPFLRVYGVRGLRVADASVFPTIPAGHTMAPAIAVAEKAADLLKEAFRKP